MKSCSARGVCDPRRRSATRTSICGALTTAQPYRTLRFQVRYQHTSCPTEYMIGRTYMWGVMPRSEIAFDLHESPVHALMEKTQRQADDV